MLGWVWLSPVVCLAEPGGELGVDVGAAGYPDTVGEQGVESSGGLETALGWLARQDQPDVDPAGAAGWSIANCLRRRRLT